MNKNIHLLSTAKPTRLWTNNLIRRLELDEFPEQHPTNIAKHIYITSDEEIEEENWYLTFTNNKVMGEPRKCEDANWNFTHCKKIILTTDQDLIKDGVQPIDDEFLEWFVKNPSCEGVELVKEGYKKNGMIDEATSYRYKIIIPQEEAKQETLEEAAKKYSKEGKRTQLEENFAFIDFINGAKWQSERMYSEEEIEIIKNRALSYGATDSFRQWFEQFKKK